MFLLDESIKIDTEAIDLVGAAKKPPVKCQREMNEVLWHIDAYIMVMLCQTKFWVVFQILRVRISIITHILLSVLSIMNNFSTYFILISVAL